jgi:hypothetical protein
MLVSKIRNRVAIQTEAVRAATIPSPASSRPWGVELEVTTEAARAMGMLARARHGRADREAHRWLARRVGDAIAGLMGVASGSDPLAEDALNYLRRLKAEGFGPVMRNHFQELAPVARAKLWREVIEYGEELPPAFDYSMMPKWLAHHCNKMRTRRPLGLGWLYPHRLPEILVGERRLNDAQKSNLLCALRRSSLDAPDPFIKAVRRCAKPDSLDSFAWALFDQWDSRDQPPRGRWTLRAIALLGGDASAVRLGHLLSVWLKDGRWHLARLGLECLHALGTDSALMQLFHFARTLRSGRWADMVRGWLVRTAQERNLSLSELGECVVPTLGLDSRGARTFSYGRRRFRATVGPCLRVSVLDEQGRRLAALPEPNGRDDLAAALPSFEEWFYFRKGLRQLRDLQGPALEQVMTAGHRWPVDDFRRIFIDKPAMFQLARGLLWAGYTAREHSRRLFRLNEDGAWIDEQEEPLKAKRFATVGLVHPVYLTEEQQQTWGEVFANDELSSPFPQLARPVAALFPQEENADRIRRWDHLSFPALALLSALKQLGWRVMENAERDCHFRPFPEANLTAIVRYSPGIPWEAFQGKEYQRQLYCYFVRGCTDGELLPKSDLAMSLNRVDRAIISDVLCHLNVLALKGE